MGKTSILVVEDERIIAKDIEASLLSFGYNVIATAATGKDAIKIAKTTPPDLIMMDIILQDNMSGIETARKILSHHNIPIIYLTAHTDNKVLKKAKKSGAYGYLVKPFKDREMHATIEMALYKHKMEDKLKQSETRLYTTLRSINDAVISTDNNGTVTFMNPIAEALTGVSIKKAQGKHVSTISHDDKMENSLSSMLDNIIREGIVTEHSRYELLIKGKSPISVELSSAPIKDVVGNRTGFVIVFRDITKRIETEKELDDYQKQLQSLASKLSLIEENEKRRIATELHDCIGQTLALTKIKLGALGKSAPSAALKRSIQEVAQLIDQTITETRSLTFELSPPILYELGLSHAVHWLADQFRDKHHLDIRCHSDDFNKPFNNNVRFFIFQAVRELLVNVVKHSGATSVSITMTSSSENLELTVEDNGSGFTGASEKPSGFGLFNIRERMNQIGGLFTVESRSGGGTKVTIVAPLNNANPKKRSQRDDQDIISRRP